MKRRNGFLMLLLAVSLLVVPWGNAAEIITEDIIIKKVLTEQDFVKNADNFIIFFSSAQKMTEELEGTGKSWIAAAKQMLREKNRLFPDLGYNAGLYTYTPYRELYPVQPYDRERFGKAIEQLPEKPLGPTDLKRGMHDMRKVIGALQGKTVVIIFSDGTVDPFRDVGKRPKIIAKDIAETNDVCVYVISSATGKKEKELLEAVASINACSRIIPFEALYGKPEFFTGALFDIQERSIVKLEKARKVTGFKMDDILFGFDSAAISAEFKEKLDRLGKFLQENPDAYAVMDGYTDSAGSNEYNLLLSRKRTEIVTAYLDDNFGVDSQGVVTTWYGETNPTADNGTAGGRRLNRRVEIEVGGL
jgi:OOP family OmpA-OmpF porin